MSRRVASAFLLLFAVETADAATWLPACFSDQMVLQRECAVPVWGTAEPGERVTVEFAGQKRTVLTDEQGSWRVLLDPLAASAEPRTLSVAGKEPKEFRDVLVGEVWLASGQSNMDFTVARTDKYYFAGTADEAAEVAAAQHPRIRMFTADWTMRDQPQKDVIGTWKTCTPDAVREFSAVAYIYARELMQKLDVPVGIITCTYGASTIQAWMSREALRECPEGGAMLEKFDRERNAFRTDEAIAAIYGEAKTRWELAAAKARVAGARVPRAPKNPDPVQDQHNVTVLFNGMIAPVAGYGLRGAIWYQGESSVSDAAIYPALCTAMLRDWRARWQLGDFPFYFVQLAGNNPAKPEPSESRLAVFREAQARCLAIPQTGMATAIDLGEEKDVHPRNKQDVGKRLARLALAKTYRHDLIACGPVFERAEFEHGAVRLHFTELGGGLEAKAGAPLRGFAIAGEDTKFVWAEAVLEGDTVVVSSPEIPQPAHVRYAWSDFPVGLALQNKAGLPALPFRADLPEALRPD